MLGTNPNVIVDGYDAASTTFGFVLLSFTQQNPGIPLSPPFPMPGCDRFIGNLFGPLLMLINQSQRGFEDTGLLVIATHLGNPLRIRQSTSWIRKVQQFLLAILVQ